MRSRQTGITFIGWVFLLTPLAVVGYAAIRLAPIYLNYFKVAKALTQTADENKGEAALNSKAVQSSLSRRFDIDGINFPQVSDVVVERDNNIWVLSVTYDDVVPLFGGVSLLVHFDKRAVVQ